MSEKYQDGIAIIRINSNRLTMLCSLSSNNLIVAPVSIAVMKLKFQISVLQINQNKLFNDSDHAIMMVIDIQKIIIIKRLICLDKNLQT